MTVSRSGNQGDRLTGPSPAIVLDAMAELRLATDEGFVDLDHSRQSTGNALPIFHQLAGRMAKLPRGILVYTENARHQDRRNAFGGGQHEERRGDPDPDIQLRRVERRPRGYGEQAAASLSMH